MSVGILVLGFHPEHTRFEALQIVIIRDRRQLGQIIEPWALECVVENYRLGDETSHMP